MQAHLVDGTYELFRYYYALPDHINGEGMDVAATRGVVGTCLTLLEEGATHIGVATDHVIESFRNDLWATYKDGSGIDPILKAQFPLVEEALEAAGFLVWAMVECEADDALGAAAHQLKDDDRLDRVIICTPDKDMGQCVTDDGRVVQLDRRKGTLFDRDGVIEKFGVPPESIPDWLALVGDTADGFPGLAGWGAKSAAAVLAHYGHIEAIPPMADDWEVGVRSAGRLAATLRENLEDAFLFRRIATLELDSIDVTLDDLEWTGPTEALVAMSERLDAPGLLERAMKLAESRVTGAPTALITGAAGTVGSAIADGLSRAGHPVGLTDIDGSGLDAVRAALPGPAVVVTADATEPGAAIRVVDEVAGALGPVGVLVNAIGTFGPRSPLVEADEAAWWRVMEVNVRAPVAFIRTVVPAMAGTSGGYVVNLASRAAVWDDPTGPSSAYATSKAALTRMTQAVAGEVAAQGVVVVGLSPGLVRSAMTEGRPGYAGLSDADFVPVERTVAQVLALVSGAHDRLHGHVVHALDDLDEVGTGIDADPSRRVLGLGPVGADDPFG